MVVRSDQQFRVVLAHNYSGSAAGRILLRLLVLLSLLSLLTEKVIKEIIIIVIAAVVIFINLRIGDGYNRRHYLRDYAGRVHDVHTGTRTVSAFIFRLGHSCRNLWHFLLRCGKKPALSGCICASDKYAGCYTAHYNAGQHQRGGALKETAFFLFPGYRFRRYSAIIRMTISCALISIVIHYPVFHIPTV